MRVPDDLAHFLVDSSALICKMNPEWKDLAAEI